MGSSLLLTASWFLKSTCLLDAKPMQKRRWLRNGADGLEDENGDEMGWRMTVKWDPYAEDDGVLLQFWVDEEMKMVME